MVFPRTANRFQRNSKTAEVVERMRAYDVNAAAFLLDRHVLATKKAAGFQNDTRRALEDLKSQLPADVLAVFFPPKKLKAASDSGGKSGGGGSGGSNGGDDDGGAMTGGLSMGLPGGESSAARRRREEEEQRQSRGRGMSM